MADSLNLDLVVTPINLVLQANASSSAYLFQLGDVSAPYQFTLLTNFVSAITPTTLTLNSTTGLNPGDYISAELIFFKAIPILAINGNVLTLATTVQWGAAPILSSVAIYRWTTVNDKTGLFYNKTSQKWEPSGWFNFARAGLAIAGSGVTSLGTGVNNVLLASSTPATFTTGGSNVFLGNDLAPAITAGSNNLLLGNTQATLLTSGASNVMLGNVVGTSITSGSRNTLLGNNAGTQLTTCVQNTLIGGFTGLKVSSPPNPLTDIDLRTSAQDYFVLSSYDGNTIRLLVDNNHNVGVGTVAPYAKLHVEGSTRIAQGFEKVNTVTTALTGIVPFQANQGAIVYYSTSAGSNWTLNVTGDSTVVPTPITLNSILPVGHSITVVALATQGAIAFFSSALQIDGVPATVRWQGAAGAPSFGNVNSIDIYSFTITKLTTTPTYLVIGSRAQFT